MTSSLIVRFARARAGLGRRAGAWRSQRSGSLAASWSRARPAAAGVTAICLTLACGVTEHPHESALVPVDVNDDFGPTPAVGPGVTTPGSTTAVPTPSPIDPPADSDAPVTTSDTAVTATTTTVNAPTAPTSDSSSPTDDTSATNPETPTVEPVTPSPTGLTINLGGVDLTPDKVIAFIHVGHSNMAGRARSPTESRAYHFTETNPRAYMYHTGSAPELALEPNTAGDAEALRGNTGGPGTALVKQAAELAPDHYFVSLGFGQASAYCSQFLPGALYYDKLIAAPKAIKGRVTFGGIFIYLGITERHGTAEDRTGFAECIHSLVTAIRTDVEVPDLPVLMNDYEVGGTGEFIVGGDVYNAIKPQIDECPTVVPNLALVSCDGVAMQDDHHFNLDGQRTWAQRALETMQSKGWFKWGM